MDDAFELQLSESGKRALAQTFGFDEWDEYWRWRQEHADDYLRKTEQMVLAGLRRAAAVAA